MAQHVQRHPAQRGRPEHPALIEPRREPAGERPERPERIAPRARLDRARTDLAGKLAPLGRRQLTLETVAAPAQRAPGAVEPEARTHRRISPANRLACGARLSMG